MNNVKKSNKLRLLSMLLMFCMVASLLSTTALAESPTLITSVEVFGVQTPIVGQPCTVDDIIVAANPQDGITVEDLFWGDGTSILDEEDTFVAGKQYQIVIMVSAQENYVFASDTSRFAINGKEPEEIYGDDYGKQIKSKLVDPCIGISEIDVSNIALPVAGEHPVFRASLPEDAKYHFATKEELIASGWTETEAATRTNGMCWHNYTDEQWMSETDVFEADKRYYFGASLIPNTGYAFLPSVVVKINGSADNEDGSNEYIGIFSVFSVTWMPHVHDFGDEIKFDNENHWLECSCGEKASVAPHVFADDSDETCEACSYRRTIIKTYDLMTKVAGKHGRISDSKLDIAENTVEKVTFIPDEGYEIEKVTVNGVEVSVTNNAIDVKMDKDKTVIVIYKQIKNNNNNNDNNNDNNPDADKPADTNNDKDKTNPKTGDGSVFLCVALMLVFCGGVVTSVSLKRKKVCSK